MKIALIGASGFVGSAVLNELVERGHTITAIVRNPDKIKAHALVTAVKVDVQNEDELADILKGHDAVVNSFSPGISSTNIYEDYLKGNIAIQNGTEKSGVKRLLVIGGAGSLCITPELQLVDSAEFPADWKAGASSARDYLNVIKKESELEWTFLSPSIEMYNGNGGVRLGTYRTGWDTPVYGENGRSFISVEDLALAIVDELEHPQFIRQRFTVGY
jgi:putative NADH-flavin reductase